MKTAGERRRASGEEFSRAAFFEKHPRVLAHETHIVEVDDPRIEGDVQHDLQEGLSPQFDADFSEILSHEKGSIEVVPDEVVASPVTFGGCVHEKVDLLHGVDAQKILGGSQVLSQA